MKKVSSIIGLVSYTLASFALPVLAQGALKTTLTPIDAEIGDIIETAVAYIVGIAAILAVAYLVYGGVIYMSGEKGAESGKKIIANALVGMAITALAYVIVNTVIDVLK